jgi:hypothetical protein
VATCTRELLEDTGRIAGYRCHCHDDMDEPEFTSGSSRTTTERRDSTPLHQIQFNFINFTIENLRFRKNEFLVRIVLHVLVTVF